MPQAVANEHLSQEIGSSVSLRPSHSSITSFEMRSSDYSSMVANPYTDPNRPSGRSRHVSPKTTYGGACGLYRGLGSGTRPNNPAGTHQECPRRFEGILRVDQDSPQADRFSSLDLAVRTEGRNGRSLRTARRPFTVPWRRLRCARVLPARVRELPNWCRRRRSIDRSRAESRNRSKAGRSWRGCGQTRSRPPVAC